MTVTREEVIRGLECCEALYNGGKVQCVEKCPYWIGVDGHVDTNCRGKLIEDALALLKALEPVTPELQSGGNYVCGNCGMYTVGFMHPLTGESVSTWKYCGKCGKKVKWE